MASPFTMLGILAKSRRANTIAQRVNATSKLPPPPPLPPPPSGQQQRTMMRRSQDSRSSSSDGGSASDSSSHIIDDNAVLVEEPSYTVIPKSNDKTDIEQEWTDVGVDGGEKARASKAEEQRLVEEARAKEEQVKRAEAHKEEERRKKEVEERKREEEEERQKREEERRKAEEEERKKQEEERKKQEEERRVQEEERRRQEEERRNREEAERKQREERERARREEEERRRREVEEQRRREEKKKREENERRMRENYEAATKIREDRAREEERVKQESVRARERKTLEGHIRRQEEKEKSLQDRLTVLENEQQAGAIQIRELMRHSEYLEDQNSLLKTQLQRQSDEVKALRSQLYDTPNQISRFLSIGVAKTGKSIEQELVSLLDVINSEVYQAAACLADLLESRGQSPSGGAPVLAAAEEARVLKMLGRGMTEVLRVKANTGADLDPLVVQVALQMCMNYCCAKIIESWCPGMWNYSEFLSTLFTSIEASEDVATVNKWRAVTHAQFRQSESTKTLMINYLSEHVMAFLSSIGLPSASKEWVTELLEERCPMIVGPALHMNNSIFEESAGDSLEAVLIKNGDIFDVGTMENSYSDGDDGDMYPGFVVATTDLGLRRSNGGRNEIIIKPKVILSTAFDAGTRRILQDHR